MRITDNTVGFELRREAFPMTPEGELIFRSLSDLVRKIQAFHQEVLQLDRDVENLDDTVNKMLGG